jgi:hypothetical protein
MKSYFQSLIPFLSLFCSCQLRRLDSIQFPSSYPDRLASRNSTLHLRLLFSSRSRLLCSFITPKKAPHRKHIYRWRGVFTPPLPINRLFIVVLISFMGMCLPSLCPAMSIHVSVQHLRCRIERKIMAHNDILKNVPAYCYLNNPSIRDYCFFNFVHQPAY